MITFTAYADNAFYTLINLRAYTLKTTNGIINYILSIVFIFLNFLFIFHIILVNKVAFKIKNKKCKYIEVSKN